MSSDKDEDDHFAIIVLKIILSIDHRWLPLQIELIPQMGGLLGLFLGFSLISGKKHKVSNI